MSEHQNLINNVVDKIADTGLKTLNHVFDKIEEIDKKSDNYSETTNYSYNFSEEFVINSEKFKKQNSNRYLIQSNHYDVELQNWELIEIRDNDYIVSGQLENKNWWDTSYIKYIDVNHDHLKVTTINNTIYRCYYSEGLDVNFGRRIYL
jgi:hypothetical protein